MPGLHLTKVALGCSDLDSLAGRAAERAEGGERRVPTRMRPRRSGELVGGNLYWIVRHRIVGCQTILRFEDRPDGRIDIVCSAELRPVAPMAKRAHQGWRYFEAGPAAAEDESGAAGLPPHLYGRLAALALI